MSETFVVVGAGLAAAKAVEELRSAGFEGDGRRVRRRAPPALRAAAAVQGLPARQRRARVGLRARPRLVRRERRRPAARARASPRSTRRPTSCAPATGSRPTTGCCSRPARRRGTSRWPTTPAPRWPTSAPSRTASASRRRSPTAPASWSIGGGWIGLETAAAARKAGCVRHRPRVARPAAAAGARPRGRRRSSPTCTASTASTCAPASQVSGDREGRRPGRRTPRRTADSVEADLVVVGIGVAPNVALAEAAGLDDRQRRPRRRAPRAPPTPTCSPPATWPTRRTRCSAAGSASSTGTPRSSRARPPRTRCSAHDADLRPAALLLHRPVRPRHGVRRQRRPRRLRRGGAPRRHQRGGGRTFTAFWLRGGRVAGRRCTSTTGTPPTTCAASSAAGRRRRGSRDESTSLEDLGEGLSS